MPRHLRPLFGTLLLLLAACGPSPSPRPAGAVLLYVEFAADGSSRIVAQTPEPFPFPVETPDNCSVYGIHPSPAGGWVAIEYQCASAPQVELVWAGFGDRSSVSWTKENSRFLSWSSDGESAYLRVDPFGSPQIVRDDPGAETHTPLDLPGTVYDLAALPDGRILYSTTQGLGFGSQTWLAEADGRAVVQILALPFAITAYLRPSPDGRRVAYITFPDSQMPFPDGELWLMDVDGANARKLTAADAGHGYAPAWSPDGREIAFVVRENPSEAQVGQSLAALHSNLYRLDVASEVLTPVTRFEKAIVEGAAWSPDGSALVFNLIRDGTIQAWLSESGNLRPAGEGSNCCGVWVPGR
jgi:sugar lactone lactonase YvrE